MKTKLSHVESARIYKSRKVNKDGTPSQVLFCEVYFDNAPAGVDPRQTYKVVGKEAAKFKLSCYDKLNAMTAAAEDSPYSRRRRRSGSDSPKGTPALILDPNSLYYSINKQEYDGECYEEPIIISAHIVDTTWIDAVAEAEEEFAKFEAEESVKLVPVWKDGKVSFVEETKPVESTEPAPKASSKKGSSKKTTE